MPYQKLVKSPYLGNYVQVGDVSNGLQGYARTWVTRNGVMPTIIDIPHNGSIISDINTKPECGNHLWYNLTNPRNKSDDWTQQIINYNNASIWLWGSLDDGGVALTNCGRDTYALTIWHGYYENNTKKWYNGKTISATFSKATDYQLVFYYCYDGFNETQASSYDGNFVVWMYDQSETIDHLNAVWVGTSPSYVSVGRIDNLLYLDNGGFQKSIIDNNYYPNSCLAYRSFISQSIYDDDIRDVPLTTGEGWEHISGTVFSGKIHKDPYAGGNGDQGGGALLDEAQDGVQPPDITDAGILGTGILTLFNPSVQDMTNFANFLYSTLTSGDADALKKLFMNPMDYIICLNMTRLDVSSQTSGSQVVHMGGIDTSVTMPKIVNQFVTYSGGSVTIRPQYNFTDYSPYTKLQIYIPYCGQHELPIDLLQGGTLYLTYNVDLLSGALTAILSVTRNRKEYMYNVENAIDNYTTLTYTGNIYCAVPIGSVDNRQYVSSLIGMASSALTSVASGNPLPLVGMAANAAMASKQTVSHNGAIGSTMGFLANQEAFLIRSRPAVNVPDNYSMWKGYPSNRFGAIKDFTEFVKVDSNTLWTDKFSKDITETECLELKQIVNDGIYIPV